MTAVGRGVGSRGPQRVGSVRVPAVYAIGDSVMQGAGPELYGNLVREVPGIEVDAAPSRQLWHAAEIIERRVARPPTPDVVIVHLGTNGLPTADQIDEVIASASHAGVVLVNVRAPRDWEAETNQRLAAAAERHAERARLVDWWSLTIGRHDWLRSDGFHLSRPGAAAYSLHLAGAVAATVSPT